MNSPFGTSLLNNLLGQKGAPSMPSFFANGYPTDFNQQIGVNNMLSDVGAYNSLPADAWGSLFSGGGSMLGEAGMTAADDWMLAGLSAI
jgi:hypothetical protein